MFSWSFLTTGHLASCPASHAAGNTCISGCESSLYRLIGILALFAGIAEGVLGHIASAFAFSEGAHSITDSAADFYGSRTATEVEKNKAEEAAIRKKASYVIAILLLAATLPILWEMWHRWHGGESPVPKIMIYAGIIAAGINGLRWGWLFLAQRQVPTSTRQGLIEHAKTDTWHGVYVLTAGITFFVFAEKWSRPVQLSVDLALAGVMCSYIVWRAWSIVRHHDTHAHHHHSR